MLTSTDRIVTTHAGALPRSAELRQLVFARAAGSAHDSAELKAKLAAETAASVDKQLAIGIDSINDGEVGKTNFTSYCAERISGHQERIYVHGKSPQPLNIAARDARKYKAYFESGKGGFANLNLPRAQSFCVEPLHFTGQAALAEDIAHFKAALTGKNAPEAYLPANTPGTMEHWLYNDYYKTTEEFLFAIAECLREEYEAIVNAGFLLQIDDPDLPDGWLMFTDMTVAEYQTYARLRIDALNHALRNIPPEKVRLHVCWGSFHGPHNEDIPLRDIANLIFSVRAKAFSIEASNPAHEHEWRVFEDVRLPEGSVLIPGVVGHCTDFIEHPELVAQRIVRYANLVGKENVIAGTDCGLAPRVGHPSIVWGKLEALAAGAKIATMQLWGR